MNCRSFLPATEFGRGIMRDDVVCGRYGLAPSGVWLWACVGPVNPVDIFCSWWSVLEGVSAAAALLESSSTTGEHVSARTHCARPWRPFPLRLPSLLHSRLEPLRSSFSEELVMVAERLIKKMKIKNRITDRAMCVKEARQIDWL